MVILLFCFPSELWHIFEDNLCQDIKHTAQQRDPDYDVYVAAGLYSSPYYITASRFEKRGRFVMRRFND